MRNAALGMVTAKTANHLKPSETIRNHPKPSKTNQHYPKPSKTTQNFFATGQKLPRINYNHPQTTRNPQQPSTRCIWLILPSVTYTTLNNLSQIAEEQWIFLFSFLLLLPILLLLLLLLLQTLGNNIINNLLCKSMPNLYQ